MRRRELTRAVAVAASLLVVIVLFVPPVRAAVFDAVGDTLSLRQPSKSPGACRLVRKCSPSPSLSPSPTASPSPTGHDPVIAAAGDIACASSTATASECHQQGTSNLLANGGFDAVLDLGDNQYDVGALSAYQTFYGPTWGRVKAITRPAPGNHEYGTANASGYYSYFGSAAGDPSKGYYSYDLGTWHVAALNSNCANVGGCGTGSPEEQWLQADLAAHSSASCTLAYWHHPRFSSGTTHGSDPTYTAFWQALYEGGADVVLVGHEHNYERFAPQTATGMADAANGIREFVVGTGGRSHYGFGTPIANSQVRNSTTFGILKLTLHPSSYDWQFVPEAGATFTDSGTTTCH
jgi:acid phosphatase type 7